jgi:hypothetical protein
MNGLKTEESREQVFSICDKLTKLIPPIDLKSKKADETLRFWLPEISWDDIEMFKREFLAQTETAKSDKDRENEPAD